MLSPTHGVAPSSPILGQKEEVALWVVSWKLREEAERGVRGSPSTFSGFTVHFPVGVQLGVMSKPITVSFSSYPMDPLVSPGNTDLGRSVRSWRHCRESLGDLELVGNVDGLL